MALKDLYAKPLASLDTLGEQLAFHIGVLRAAPRSITRYPREIMRILAEVTLGSGALAVIGGTIGVLAGIVPFFACTKLKNALGYDDALDTFGVHAIGGTLGAFLTGVLATPDANPNLNLNLTDVVGATLWVEQLKAIGVTLAISLVGTALLGYLLKVSIGLRPSAEDEESGLDVTGHGERGYQLGEV